MEKKVIRSKDLTPSELMILSRNGFEVELDGDSHDPVQAEVDYEYAVEQLQRIASENGDEYNVQSWQERRDSMNHKKSSTAPVVDLADIAYYDDADGNRMALNSDEFRQKMGMKPGESPLMAMVRNELQKQGKVLTDDKTGVSYYSPSTDEIFNPDIDVEQDDFEAKIEADARAMREEYERNKQEYMATHGAGSEESVNQDTEAKLPK